MRKLLLGLLFCLLTNPAFAFLAIDGTATASSSTSTCVMTLTTTSANDMIVVFVTDSVNTDTVLSVTATGLTFTNRKQLSWGAAGVSTAEEWSAPSSGILTSKTITVTMNTQAAYSNRCNVFGISGANTTTPYDVNVSLPASAQFVDSTKNISATISTTAPETMLIGFVGAAGGVAGIVRPSGFNQIVNGGTNSDPSYKVVTDPLSSVSEQWTWTATTTARFLILDAIQASSATPPTHSHGFGG